MAPEIIRGEKYSTSVDIWATAIVAYVALSGRPVFEGESDFEIFANILCLNYEFPPEEWDYISLLARSFIESILVEDPDKRPNAPQALQHQWIISRERF